jgi:hypothetical protein
MTIYNYKKINNEISKLRVDLLYSKKKKNYYFFSLINLFLKKINQLAKFPLFLFFEICIGYKYLKKTFFLKNKNKKINALIVGNGPSLNFLKKKDLIIFKKKNHLLAVNYWNEQSNLCSVIPDYLCLSDPSLFDKKFRSRDFKKRDKNLLNYLQRHSSIILLIPPRLIKNIKESGLKNRLYSFVDTELNYWVNFTCPLLPRGYISVSFLKLLSFGLWLGYKKIFVLGFDNTYPKDLFSNFTNRILEYNHHTNSKNDYVQDQTAVYSDIGDILGELSELFFSIRRFKKYKNIFNLDQFSVNTNFKKKSILNKKV